jgi:hypothetical protein
MPILPKAQKQMITKKKKKPPTQYFQGNSKIQILLFCTLNPTTMDLP